MAGRTPQTGLGDWDAAQDLESLVQDKRSTKRANGSKRRRRNRRYENRMLTAEFRGVEVQGEEPIATDLDDELDDDLLNDAD
jgi:hypothetical protein